MQDHQSIVEPEITFNDNTRTTNMSYQNRSSTTKLGRHWHQYCHQPIHIWIRHQA